MKNFPRDWIHRGESEFSPLVNDHLKFAALPSFETTKREGFPREFYATN